jgi:hypothetical protein
MCEKKYFNMGATSIVLNDDDLLLFGTSTQYQTEEVPAKSLRIHTALSDSETAAIVLANVPSKRDISSVSKGEVQFSVPDRI